MTGEQLAILIPGSFGSEHNTKCDMSCYDKMISYDAEKYYSWAEAENKIVGIMPWNWNGCGSGCIEAKCEIGTTDARMVASQAAWKKIGSAIK